MGWSADSRACATLDEWTRVCITQQGAQNTYVVGDHTYMIEHGPERADGAITGQTFRWPTGSLLGSRRVGGWRIEPDGTVTRWPRDFRAIVEGARS